MPDSVTATNNESTPVVTEEVRLKGIGSSPGVATGPVVVLRQDGQVVRRRKIVQEQLAQEIERFEAALLRTRQQIQEIKARIAQSVGEQDAAIFDAHLLVVEDTTIFQAVISKLTDRLLCVEYIYQEVTNNYAEQMMAVDDEYLQERANDIYDVSRRVLRNLRGSHEHERVTLDAPSIILADSLALSDLVSIDRSSLLGFATEQGSKTSHAAIIARSLNIPAVVGLRDSLEKVESGTNVLIDGFTGYFILNPTEQTKYEYGRLEQERDAVDARLSVLRDTLATTTDGARVVISANVELPEDLPLVTENGAEGIGLYRTEFLFLNRDDFPDEEEQVRVYRQVAEAALPHYVIIRTLDVGGDKVPTNLRTAETEMNPFLGWRGIRLTLDREDIFRTQLRAILRASVVGNVRMMFPMVTEVGEMRRAKKLLAEMRHELAQQGYPMADRIEVGIMIEVPSAALTADVLARESDFFSIGTNDLVQYTLAVDRLNEKVASLYQPTHPAILRLIVKVVEEAHKAGIWVGVCGEMASDILMTPLLVGLGVDELSMGSIFVPRVKKVIQSINKEEASQMAQRMLGYWLPEDILRELEDNARRLYPDLMVG
jgi:phosphoenolpyruvate-protein phosphotransferase (PTS system enzyme I)